jgi:hypothetical protein
MLMMAEVLRISADSANAILIYKKVLEIASNNVDALGGAGLSLLDVSASSNNRALMQEGLNYLKRFIDIAPATHPLKKDIEAAIDLMQREVKIKPKKSSTNSNSKGGPNSPENKESLYTNFTGCYKETDQAKRDACMRIAKEYLIKYEKDNDEFGAWVRKQYDRYVQAEDTIDLYGRFNKSVEDPKSVNVDEAFTIGKQIIAKTPDLIDVPIVLASIGFDNAAAPSPNNKYNAEAINYAKQVIQQIESGNTSTNWGAYAYSYKNDEYPDGKSNTLGWMNYTIGYIMFYRQSQKKEALPYLYKALQFHSGTADNPEIYRAIGINYVDEFIRIDNERVEKIKAAGNLDTDETRNLLALQKGYIDRAVEAYAKAYRVASGNPKMDQAYKDAVLKRVKELYAIRFNNKMDKFDMVFKSIMNKLFTDPTSAVVPIFD